MQVLITAEKWKQKERKKLKFLSEKWKQLYLKINNSVYLNELSYLKKYLFADEQS